MTIVFFHGKPRVGKTLAQVPIALHDYKAGRGIFANFPMFRPIESYLIKSPDEILDVAFKDLDRYPKTFFIQEADKWFDARQSLRKANRLLSSFTGQSGKRNIDIYYDSQYSTRIDRALEDITEWYVYCDVIRDENKEPIVYTQEWNDIYRPSNSFKKSYPAFLMEEYYKLYDTYYLTVPTQR